MTPPFKLLPPEPGVVFGAVFDQTAPDVDHQIQAFARALEQARARLGLEAFLLVPEVAAPLVFVRALAARLEPGQSTVSGEQATVQAVRGYLDQVKLTGGGKAGSRSHLRLP